MIDARIISVVYDAAFNWANDMIHTALVNVVSMFAGTMQSAHIVDSYIHLIEIIIFFVKNTELFLQYESFHLPENTKILVSR